MKKTIGSKYFLDDIATLTKFKDEFNKTQKNIKIKESKLDTLFLLFKNFYFLIKYIFSKTNNVKVKNEFIIKILIMYLVFLIILLFIYLIFNKIYVTEIQNIIPSFYAVVGSITLLIVLFTVIVIYVNVKVKNDSKNIISHIRKEIDIDPEYGFNVNQSIKTTKINNNLYLFKKKINFNEINNQFDFVINFLINVNKLDLQLSPQIEKEIKENIKNILDYEEYINYFELLTIKKMPKDKIKKYYNEIIKHIENVNNDIENIKNTNLYKINFTKEGKNFKKYIEKRFNELTKKIKTLNQKLEKTKKIKIKKEIKESIDLLEKELKELEVIRSSYTDINVLKKKLEIIKNLEEEFRYLEKEEKDIENLERDNEISKILNLINKR